MSFVYQFLLGTTLITLLILVRIFANRYTMRQKLNCSHAGQNCHSTDCSEQSEMKRSACHAP